MPPYPARASAFSSRTSTAIRASLASVLASSAKDSGYSRFGGMFTHSLAVATARDTVLAVWTAVFRSGARPASAQTTLIASTDAGGGVLLTGA
jgi:hypothetical protein